MLTLIQSRFPSCPIVARQALRTRRISPDGQNDDRPFAFFGAESSHAAGGANQLAALAGVHFNVMDFEAAGDVGQGHGIAQFRRRIGAVDDGGSDLQAIGGKDVSLFAVLVLDQGDEARAIGIVFDADDFGGHAIFIALEVDEAIKAFVAAAAMLGGDDAMMVAAIGATLADWSRDFSGLNLVSTAL